MLLDFKVAQYQGIQKATVATLEGASERFQLDAALWAEALGKQDVEALWELWNSAGPKGVADSLLKPKPYVPQRGS
eukprot:1058793-Amphidinium_carterae.1